MSKKNKTQEVELNEYIFSNSPSNKHTALLGMFYKGAFQNTIGIMEAYNADKGTTELLLVGVEFGKNGEADTYPIARVLGPEDLGSYLAPDGKGSFYGNE